MDCILKGVNAAETEKVGKRVAQTQIELTNDKDDKDPFHKKQQKAVSGESFDKKREKGGD